MAMPREKAQAAPTVRPKVPMRRLGADCFAVAMKRGNARGAKGAGHRHLDRVNRQREAAMFAAERATRRRRKKSLFVASATNIACKHFGLVSHDTIVPVERSPRLVALPPGAKRDLPPRVPGGGGTMRAQWANWKKLSPVFGSKDLIWTDALSRVVVCWRPSSRISPGPVPRIDELWSRY